METLYQINKPKMRLVFKFIAYGWTIFVFSTLAIVIITKNLPEININAISIFALFLFSLPLLVYAILHLDLWYTQRISRVAFETSPLNQLSKIGFSTAYVNEESNWLWTEIAWRGKVNEFMIDAFVTRDFPREVMFMAFLKFQQIDRRRYERLASDFKKEDIEFDFDAATKSYKIKNISRLQITDLEKSLLEFTELLKKEHFEPA